MTKTPRVPLEIDASCACGAVTIGLAGPVYSMLACACLDCQKATGTGHATLAIVNVNDVRITGETQGFTRPADSGARFTRYFCPACGTPLYGTSSRAPASIMLPAGLFGTNNDWFSPTQLIFARSHHDWDLMANDLPCHQTYRETP